ncbi:hypothetical protein ABZ863_12145 [Saccharomonospora sp. NPDC046836]|uniref:hypothetical protein n=1 Tax=Saccharomonospora sp. NPDC046836 TaxID=3156921 RepID=UPI0033D65AD1
MRPRMTVLAAVVTAFGLGLAGCGQQSRAPQSAEQTPQPPGPAVSEQQLQRTDAIAAWASGYCGAVSELVRSFSTMPSIDPSTPQRATRTSSELLGVMIGGIDRTLDELDRLGRAPMADAEDLKARAVATYTDIRDRAIGAKELLDTATTPEASTAAIGSVRAPLEDLGRLNLLDGFDAQPELQEASLRAPECRQLTDSGGTPRFDGGPP